MGYASLTELSIAKRNEITFQNLSLPLPLTFIDNHKEACERNIVRGTHRFQQIRVFSSHATFSRNLCLGISLKMLFLCCKASFKMNFVWDSNFPPFDPLLSWRRHDIRETKKTMSKKDGVNFVQKFPGIDSLRRRKKKRSCLEMTPDVTASLERTEFTRESLRENLQCHP